MRPLGYLVPLMVLCAALGAQVADVVAAAKKTPAPAARGAAALGAAPTAAAVVATSHQAGAGAGPTTKTSTLTASSLPAAHPAPAAKGLASSADKKKTKPHRTASTAGGRRPAGGEDTTSGGGPDLGRSGLALAPATVGGVGQGVTAASDRDSRPDSDSAPDGGAVLKSSVTSRTPTKQGAYPFLVAVQRICGSCQTRHSCGGVLLAPQWVLGVAQCAETQPGEYLVVRAGESFIWPGGQTPTQKVVEVVWHEAPSSTDDYPRYDLILLRLENPFTFGEFINAINMAPPSHSLDGPVSVAGWSPPGSAQQVEVNVTHATVRPVEECSRITSQETLLADTLCAQPVEPFLDKCAYDLGDPVIVEGDNPLLVGVLSRWYQPCSPERPVVAIKISVAYAWIFEKVNPQPVTARPPPHPGTSEAAPPAPSPTPWPTWPPQPTAPTQVTVASPPTASPTPASPSPVTWHTMPTPPPTVPTTPPTPPTPPTMPAPPPTPPTHRPTPTPPAPEPWPLPTGVYPGSSSTPVTPATAATPATPATPATSRPPLGLGHVRPMTVSSSSASGALTNTTSTSDVALNPGHSESSLSYSLGTAGTEPGKPALSNSVSVGWSNCRDTGGALGMSYALSYSFLGEGAASAASTVNATCLDMNAVQSQGWSISTSGASAPVGVRSFITEHLASIPGLPRQPTLKYL